MKNFDPNKDYTFNEVDKVHFEKCIKELEEKGFVTAIEMGKLVDRIVCGMSEEDIRLKYYFDYFGIG